MVYQLSRAVTHESLRQGAAPVPAIEPPLLRTYTDPLLVWGPDLPAATALDNAHREICFTVHNAGGTACRLSAVTTDVGWLTASWQPGEIAPDGRAVPVRLRLNPAAHEPGEHAATVTLEAVWGDRGKQRLVRTLALHVPDAPIAWFDDESVHFSGEWPLRQVTISAAKPGRLTYRDREIAQFNTGTVALYPAEYRLEGYAGKGQAWAESDGLPSVALPVPGTWFVPGPSRETVLRNVGTRPLDGRILPGAPWLEVTPETVALQPGEAVKLRIECRDDGSHFDEHEAQIALRSQFGDMILAQLAVARAFVVPGPRPQLPDGPLQFPAVFTGASTTVSATVSNSGSAPLVMRVPGDGNDSGGPVSLAPGASALLPVMLGPAHTLTPRHLQGALLAETNAVLPAWRYFHMPFVVDVVSAELLTTAITFGEVRYQKRPSERIKVKRSDLARSKLAVTIPAEYADVLRLSGDMLTLHNNQPRPILVDTEVEVRDDALGGFVLGAVHVSGRCLVPKLEVSIQAIALVPGQQAVVPIMVVDAGGGLDLRRVESDQDWVRVERRGDKWRAQVITDLHDRGTRPVALTFHSNDFVNPEQTHTLTVHLKPTFQMRVQDVLDWCLDQTWGRLRKVFRSNRSRR